MTGEEKPWIEHNGEGRPHPPTTYVQVQMRNGSIGEAVSAFIRWPWVDDPDDWVGDETAEVDVLRWREIPKPLTKDEQIDLLQSKLDRATEALEFYGCEHQWPNDGPWGVDSQDFGNVARATLAAIKDGQ